MSSDNREMFVILPFLFFSYVWVCLQVAACCMRRKKHDDTPRTSWDHRKDPFYNAGRGRNGYGCVDYR